MPVEPIKLPTDTAHLRKRVIYFWSERQKPNDVFEKWLSDNLTSKPVTGLLKVLNMMSQTVGPQLHPSDVRYKHEFDKINAIKDYQTRLFGVLVPVHDFVILHPLIKKRDALTKQEKKTIGGIYDKFEKEISANRGKLLLWED